MNNLNLKFAAQKMTKEQMKNVTGAVATYRCTYWNACSNSLGSFPCTGDSANECQDAADLYCYSNNCCGDIDCQ